jgi:hypothetical protein
MRGNHAINDARRTSPPTAKGISGSAALVPRYHAGVAFPTSRANVERAEQALGRGLPTALRERLMRDNGGEIEVGDDDGWQLHPVWDETTRRTIARTTSHIVHETQEALSWPRFPEGAIAIASNGTGDQLILRAGSNDIEFWDHETGECSRVTVNWN